MAHSERINELEVPGLLRTYSSGSGGFSSTGGFWSIVENRKYGKNGKGMRRVLRRKQVNNAIALQSRAGGLR